MSDLQPIVDVQDVHFSYSAGSPVLRGVNLRLAAGEMVALAGPNGSGKTTLAKHLNGLLRPVRGRVLIDGRESRDRAIGDLARTTGYVFQNPDHQIFLPTVAEEVAYGPGNLGMTGDALDARIAEALDRFGLADVAGHHPTLLGRGRRRRVALAAVWAMGPSVLVLDEPTGGLDRRATLELMSLLHDMVAEGRVVVLITHDMRLIADHAPRMVAMHEGRIVADAPTAEVMADRATLNAIGIAPPPVMRLAASLKPLGMAPALNVDQFCQYILDLHGHRSSVGRSPQATDRRDTE